MLKPKTSVQNMRALHYKRYTNIEVSSTTKIVYQGSYGDYWVFDKSSLYFVNIERSKIDETNSKIININNLHTRFKYGDILYVYMHPPKYYQYHDSFPAESYKTEE